MEEQLQDADDNSRIDASNTSGSTTLKNDELGRCLNIPIEDVHKVLNPWPFRKINKRKFPCLPLIARRLFCIPVTSASAERSFSAAESVIAEHRSSLDPQILNGIPSVRSIQSILEQKQIFFPNITQSLLCLFCIKPSINKISI